MSIWLRENGVSAHYSIYGSSTSQSAVVNILSVKVQGNLLVSSGISRPFPPTHLTNGRGGILFVSSSETSTAS